MDNTLERMKSCGVISICRKIYGDDLLNLSRALCLGGVNFIEVTFDQSDSRCLSNTAEAISMLRENNPEMCVGAGTVLTKDQVKAAYDAGAGFIISPNTNACVIEYTKSFGMISVPGAMTPSEILSAWDFGADIVKLFPAATLGLRYLKDIRAPISHIPLLATGGITPDNFEDFIRSGCCGAGIGSYLSDKKLIKEGNFGEFTSRARLLNDIFEKVCSQ